MGLHVNDFAIFRCAREPGRSWRRAALALVLLCAALAACTRGSEWQVLTVNEGGFSVLMRGQAHYARQPVDTPAGKMVAHLYSSDRPDAYFAVGYADYPIAHVLGAATESVLGGVRDTWVKRIEGRLVMTSPIELGGHPGLEFTAEGRVKGEDTFLQGKLFLVDQRLYQVIALGRKGGIAQGIVNRYLGSFKLIPAGGAMIQLAPGTDK